MGGAFIGIADDATAASWNPAGLIQLEKPELSIVGAYQYRKEEISSVSHPEINNTADVGKRWKPYLSNALSNLQMRTKGGLFRLAISLVM